jgi:hypothetical protein
MERLGTGRCQRWPGQDFQGIPELPAFLKDLTMEDVGLRAMPLVAPGRVLK